MIHIEYGDELRYLQTTSDGAPRFHPLVWAYDHPDAPNVPSAVPAFTYRQQVDTAYDKEAKTLEWGASEFLPANPGSAFVTPTQLMAMAETPIGAEISRDSIQKLQLISLLATTPSTGSSPRISRVRTISIFH